MSKVKNATMGSSEIHPVAFATTGLSTCIAVIIVTDLCGVFLGHISPASFMDIRTPVIDRAQECIESVCYRHCLHIVCLTRYHTIIYHFLFVIFHSSFLYLEFVIHIYVCVFLKRSSGGYM
jgi:hypothetical protein